MYKMSYSPANIVYLRDFVIFCTIHQQFFCLLEKFPLHHTHLLICCEANIQYWRGNMTFYTYRTKNDLRNDLFILIGPMNHWRQNQALRDEIKSFSNQHKQ